MSGDLVPFKRKARNRPLYDWQAAWLFFAADPKITYGVVASKFGMTKRSVTLHAQKNNWNERRDELVRQATEANEKLLVRSLQERHARTIMVAEKLRDVILKDGAEEVEVKDAVSALPAYAKLEQLFGGGATENLRALPTIDPDNLSVEELETLAALLEKGQRAS